MARETVSIHHIEPLKADAARERIVGHSEDGRILVAIRDMGAETAICETVYELADAEKLARACLAGDSQALTTPALARILSSAIIVFSRAAFLAGALQEQSTGSGADDGFTDD